jgi:hypothetical protein
MTSSMKYPVDLEGFEGRTIEVQYSFLRGAKLLVDGEPAPKGQYSGTFVLSRNDGRELLAAWKPRFPDVPQLVVAGKVINVVRPLMIYEWVWCGLPLPLVFLPDFLTGLLVGMLGLWANIQVFRTGLRTLAKYGAALGVTLLSAGFYYLLMMFFGTVVK